MYDYYLSGPMRGYPDLNRAAFQAANDRLTSQGFTVWNPCVDGLPDYLPAKLYIMHDIEALLQCSEVYMLKGWEESVGATAEYYVAQWANIPIFIQDDQLDLTQQPQRIGLNP
jgi:Domain of unknown function (DUF4406)